MKNENRTTVVVAVLTFVGLALISLVAWALTRDPGETATSVPVVQASAAAPADHAHPHDFETVSAEELKAGLEAGTMIVLDVRTIDQYSAQHVAGALQIPLTRVEGEIPYLPKDKLIVTYCTCPAEETSGQAAMILVNGGLRSAALKGGLDAWAALGYPTAAGVQ
jgi:rhodanese-related sulfurtransferase